MVATGQKYYIRRRNVRETPLRLSSRYEMYPMSDMKDDPGWTVAAEDLPFDECYQSYAELQTDENTVLREGVMPPLGG